MNRSSSLFRHTAVAAVVSLGFVANAAWAVTPFVVKDIKVEGLQRVDAGTVFGSIPIKVGDTYDDEKGASAIRALYNLGVFNDVRVEPRGGDVVVVVQERQIINQVDISDTDAYDKKTLLAGLAKVGVASGQPLEKATQELAVQELKRQYEAKGYYAANITTTVTPIERGRANLAFHIEDGPSARIRDIHFVGNHVFKDSTLRDQMELDTGSWMSWYTKSDRYAEDRLNTDLAAIREYYLNRGYLEFKVDSVQAALSQDRRNIDVTVNVTEGPRYVVSGVSLAGNYLGKEDEFRSLVSIKPGEVYKLQDVSNTVRAMSDRFGNYGYAFAKVTAEPVINREQQQVALVLNAAPDQRAYVRNINVKGNAKTRDEVIRREFRQFESSWYNTNKVRLSRDRVDRLGYFQEVAVDTVPVPGTPDLADLDVKVKERPTGSINLGAGYSSSDKLGFMIGLSQENIFGSGQSFSGQIDTSKYNKSIALSSTDPYFTPDGVSRTYNVFYTRTQPYQSQGGGLYDYDIQNIGANVNFGIPVTESDTIYVGGGYEQYKIKAGSGTTAPAGCSNYPNIPNPCNPANPDSWKLTPEQQAFIKQNGGKNSAWGIPLTLGWARDSRDSSLAPNRGMYQRLQGAISPTGDLKYALATYRFQYYQPLSKNYTFALNTDLAYGVGLGGKEFPYFKNFYSGGLGSVRGFEQGGMGAQGMAWNGQTYATGGNKKFNVNLELVTPFPGAGNDKTLRMFGFVDAGQVYSSHPDAYNTTVNARNVNAKKVRASVGFGLRWISPVGPLSLAFGFPVIKYEGDKLQKVQFQIGTNF